VPNHEITTERLFLLPFDAAKAQALHQLWTDPAVRRYLWDGKIISCQQTEEIIQTSSRLFQKHGFGLWALESREDTSVIGFGGYWFFRDPPELELVIGLNPGLWGKGLATEAGRALLGYAFERLGFCEVRASTDVANVASIRLMERLGMRHERRAVVGGLDTVFYQLSRA
jgi:ribosomal-protein-alanine N-acetyltransferase